MYKMDYDSAANYWLQKDKSSTHMDKSALEKRINTFIESHNTCTLATASSDMVRCTPLEYNYVDNYFYIFSEGGLKFKSLKENKHVGMAIYDSQIDFSKLKGLQVEGHAEMVEPFSEEYLRLLEVKKIPIAVVKKLPQPMNLIKIIPTSYDLLDSGLKKAGFGSRQHLDIT